MTSIDYAAAFGIHSVPAAAIFTAIYVPLGLWFIRQSIKNTTYVYIILTLFCAMRVTAFLLRAIMAHSSAQGSSLDLFIADQVLFGVGFFALLYSAYTLVLDRDVLAGGERGSLFSPNLLRNPHVFRSILTVGVALGIVGTVDSTSSNPSNVSTGKTLRKASTILFLVLTIVQVLQTAWFFRAKGYSVTLNDASKQNNEHLWYPLVALPEFLAVLCYSVSGLVPTRAELKAADGVEMKSITSV
ncbi:hypothetical protein C8R44DRAFT_827588 [Mycena epipterygia]|nr:hypothetical protein C8R44DRAFT_827588 [Mycena epipterygia]